MSIEATVTMRMSYRSSLPLLGVLAVFLAAGPARAAVDVAANKSVEKQQDRAAAVKKFDVAVERIESVQLPLNKVFLYRQAAVALAGTDKPRAVQLLKHALADIDAAEAAMQAEHTLDDKTRQQMEFHRLPVIMLMERIDPEEALNVVGPPQTADRDTAFFALFFERLATTDADRVLEMAQRKLSYGVTPAVVGAYDVLRNRAPGPARTLATTMVMKLTKTDPADDPVAVQAAFGLLRLLRTDVGSLAPTMIVDQGLLSPESLHDLFTFIGDAFVAAKDPEMLILGERPGLYVAALELYAPDKAQEVKRLPFAAPGAKSLIFSAEKPVYDANHPDPATLTPEQVKERAAMKARVDAQMKETEANSQVLIAKINQPGLAQKERDDAVFALVDQANRAISLARSAALVLDREAFRNGEVEFYNLGIVTSVLDPVSAVLQRYAVSNPQIAEAAAAGLDGAEVQTQVELQIAIKEMTGNAAYLVIVPKPPPGARVGTGARVTVPVASAVHSN